MGLAVPAQGNGMGSVRQKIRRLHGLLLLAFHVRNWAQAYRARRSQPPPPLWFRNGTKLEGGAGDDPLQCFLTVFQGRYYRRRMTEHDRGIYVDIGANIGLVSIDWATRLQGVSVQAYEPDPRTFTMLRENVSSNGLQLCVAVYNEAVGRAPGSMELVRGERSLATSAVLLTAPAGEKKFVANTVGLDEVVRRCGACAAITLVKVNAEGSEADIVEGASREALKKISQFAIQYHAPELLERCRQKLQSAGFDCIADASDSKTGLLYATRAVQPIPGD